MENKLYKLSRISKTILFTGLCLIAICLFIITNSILSHESTALSVILHIYAPQIEYVLMSLTIIIVASLLFDITYKELNQ